MDSLNQIAQDLISIVRSKRVDDYNVTTNQVKRWIDYKRSVFIKNELNKKKKIDEDYIQDLKCVNLELVPDGDCGSNCLSLRTCKPIPTPLATDTGIVLTRVGPVKKSLRAFTLRDFDELPFLGNGRFNNNEVFAYYLNGHIHIRTSKSNPLSKLLRTVNIRGVFEDPEEVNSFLTCSGTPCGDINSPYPIKKWMIDYIINDILETRFGITEQSITDVNNNEADAKEI